MLLKNRKLRNFFIYPGILGKTAFYLSLVTVNIFNINALAYSHLAGTWIYWVIIFMLLFLSAAMGIWYAHKLTGPMVSIRRTCDLIASGEKDLRIKLRPADEFKDVAESINKMIDALQSKK